MELPWEQQDLLVVEQIHTYDRIAFKRCRRKWAWSSPLRAGLVPIGDANANLWFGAGFHFCLEDLYGYKRFGSPREAFLAYEKAFKEEEKPIGWEYMADDADGIIDYYLNYWLKHREDYKTLWLDGAPCVEMEFEIPLVDVSEYCQRPVSYHGTFDRLVEDDKGNIWIEDYKTAARFNTSKLETDPQVGAYLWAVEQFLQRPVEGMLYTQFLKELPSWPKMLAKGGFSQDKRQKTPYAFYRAALMDAYGKIPPEYTNFLNSLLDNETPEGDRYIRRDKAYRSAVARANEATKITYEAIEMMNPNLLIYPNPTRDCSFDCPFRTVCITQDDGSDWEFLLNTMFKRKEEKDPWRKKIKFPSSNK